jgi:hypothetical protein
VFKCSDLRIENNLCSKTSDVISSLLCYHCDDMQSCSRRELHGLRAHVPSGSQNHYSLTRLRLCIVEEHLPCSDGDHGY